MEGNVRLTIHWGGGPTTFEVSAGLGKGSIETPSDLAFKALEGVGTSIVEQAAKPELDELQQQLYNEFKLQTGGA